MLVVLKKLATDEDLRQLKQQLIDLNFDFHQSTGIDRIILGIIGETSHFDVARLRALPGVLEVFKIPEE
jgi:hypothetical protein